MIKEESPLSTIQVDYAYLRDMLGGTLKGNRCGFVVVIEMVG